MIDGDTLRRTFVVVDGSTVVGSGAAGTATYAATTPIMLGQTSGTTVIVPIQLTAFLVGTAPAAETKIMIGADTKLRYSTGGLAVTQKSPAVGSGSTPDTDTVKWYVNRGAALTANAASANEVFIPTICIVGGTAGVGFTQRFTLEEQEMLTVQPRDSSGASFFVHAFATGGLKMAIGLWYKEKGE